MADTTWFAHDRFGMFIHWGLYSVPAGVWKGKKIRKNYSECWEEHSSEYMPFRRQEELIGLIHACRSSCLVNSRINFASPSDRCDYLSMMDNCFPDTTFDKAWETSGILESGQPVRTRTSGGGTWVSYPKDASGLLLPVIKVEINPRG